MAKLNLKGIQKTPNGKWAVRIQRDGERFTVGTFRTRKLAIEERDDALARIITAEEPFLDDAPAQPEVRDNPSTPTLVQRVMARFSR